MYWSVCFYQIWLCFLLLPPAAVSFSPMGLQILILPPRLRRLCNLYGNATYWLFAIGIIGVGLLAIPVMAGASSYAISESLGKRQGLNNKLKQAYAFYGIIIISMLIGLGLNFIGLNPIKALIYAAIGNGIVAPVILVLILLLARKKHIMGEWVNGKWSAGFGWVLAVIDDCLGTSSYLRGF